MKIPKISKRFDRQIDNAIKGEDWRAIRALLIKAGYPFPEEETSGPVYATQCYETAKKEVADSTTWPNVELVESVFSLYDVLQKIHPIEKSLCAKNTSDLVRWMQLAGHKISYPEGCKPKPGKDTDWSPTFH